MNTENNHKFWSESLAGLKNNPVFAMSLGSKELFHSNFLAFIFMHKSAGNLRKWLYEKATVKKPDKPIEFDKCFREKSNFDLLFKIKGEEKFILIENKFKSLPDSEQLKKYSEKLQEKEIENKSGNKVKYKGIDSGFKKEDKRHSKLYINTGNTCCFILSPKITALKQKVKKWKECFYDDLISEIEKISFPKELQQIVDFYCAFTKSILRAMGEFIEKSFPENIDKVIWLGKSNVYSDEIIELRIDDIFKKIWGQLLLEKLLDSDLKDKISYSKVDYSHDSVCIDFRKNIDDKITYGVQLQENYFNAYVELKENITSEQEKKIDELLRNNVLCNNVIKELKNSQLCRHYKEKFRYHSIFLGEYFSIDDLKNRLKSVFDNFAEKDTRAKLKAITV